METLKVKNIINDSQVTRNSLNILLSITRHQVNILIKKITLIY